MPIRYRMRFSGARRIALVDSAVRAAAPVLSALSLTHLRMRCAAHTRNRRTAEPNQTELVKHAATRPPNGQPFILKGTLGVDALVNSPVRQQPMRLGARRHSYASMNVSMRFSFAELDALMKAVCSRPTSTLQYCQPSAAPISTLQYCQPSAAPISTL